MKSLQERVSAPDAHDRLSSPNINRLHPSSLRAYLRRCPTSRLHSPHTCLINRALPVITHLMWPPPPRKKSKGGIIALVIILVLALLGGGGWAVYKYVIKPSLDKKTGVTSFSPSDDDDGDIESFSTDDGDDDSRFFGDKKEDADKQAKDIPQGLDNKNRYNEPFGMTDEEAAQLRGTNRDVPQGQPKNNATVKNKKKNDKFKGWTKEEKARWRKMKQNNEPFGMTDEEAAEMLRNRRR